MAFEGPVDQLPSAEVAEFSEDDETETETSFDVDGAAQPQDYVDEVDDRSGSPEGNDGPSLGGQAGSQAASLLKPRSYQLEMLEKSLESNIIVAVGNKCSLSRVLLSPNRWILEVERHICTAMAFECRRDIIQMER